MKSLVYALRTQAEARTTANARQRKPAQWPRPRIPTAEALIYYRLLRYWVQVVQHIVKRDIVPQLPDILAQSSVAVSTPSVAESVPQVRRDTAGKDIDQAFAEATAAAEAAIPEADITRGVQRTALRVTEWNGNELNRQVQTVAKINLFDDSTGLAEHLELFVADNVKLVKSVAFGQLEDLKGVVTRGARAGLSHIEVAQQIGQQFGVTQRRAATIARDQVSKLNGELNQLRQTNLGVKRYRWSSSQDERVRKSHRALNGTIQLWAAPPVVDERTGERGHPGQPIQCRCVAIPIIDDVLVEAGLMDPEDVELTQPSPGPARPLRPVPPPPSAARPPTTQPPRPSVRPPPSPMPPKPPPVPPPVRPPPSPMPPKPPPVPPPVRPPTPLPVVRPTTPDPAAAERQVRQQIDARLRRELERTRERMARTAAKRAALEAGIAAQLVAAERAAQAEAARAAAELHETARAATRSFNAAATKATAAKRKMVATRRKPLQPKPIRRKRSRPKSRRRNPASRAR